MKPYYEEDGITIYHGDCSEVLPQPEADSIVTDPPYGVGKDYGVCDDTLETFQEAVRLVSSRRAAVSHPGMPYLGSSRAPAMDGSMEQTLRSLGVHRVPHIPALGRDRTVQPIRRFCREPSGIVATCSHSAPTKAQWRRPPTA